LTDQVYAETVSNDYLDRKEEIRGPSSLEVKVRAADKLAGWAEQERRGRERDAVESKKELAEYDSRQARSEIRTWRNLFRDSLKGDPKVDWVALYNDALYEPFIFREAPPTYKKVVQDVKVPPESGWEIFLPGRKKERLCRQEMARRIFKERLQQYEERKAAERSEYEAARSRYLEKQIELNDAVDQLKFAYETGKPHGIEGYARLVLARSAYPGAVKKDFEVFFDKTGRTVIVNYLLPDWFDMPETTGYEYRAASDEIVPAEMGNGELTDFYRSALAQIAVRTVYEIFRSDYRKAIGSAAFNGWLIAAGDNGGREYAWCFLTCKASLEQCEKLDPETSSPEEIFRLFKGVMAESPALGDAVRPLVNVIVDGSRFAGAPAERP